MVGPPRKTPTSPPQARSQEMKLLGHRSRGHIRCVAGTALALGFREDGTQVPLRRDAPALAALVK